MMLAKEESSRNVNVVALSNISGESWEMVGESRSADMSVGEVGFEPLGGVFFRGLFDFR